MKLNRKLLIISLAVLLSVMLVLFSNSEKADDFYRSFAPRGDIKVTISINCGTIQTNYSSLDESLKNTEYVPEDGVILPETTVYAQEGDSVLDALKAVTKANKIQLEYTQSPNDSYVEGINHIYEFSCGELSGWMYKVNGAFARTGCNSCILKDGDVIEWVYTCNLGKDVGEEF